MFRKRIYSTCLDVFTICARNRIESQCHIITLKIRADTILEVEQESFFADQDAGGNKVDVRQYQYNTRPKSKSFVISGTQCNSGFSIVTMRFESISTLSKFLPISNIWPRGFAYRINRTKLQ
jgi:hypothetical protein